MSAGAATSGSYDTNLRGRPDGSAPGEEGDQEAPPPSVGEDDVIREVKSEDLGRVVAEMFRGQEIASVYIQVRRGALCGGERQPEGRLAGGSYAHDTEFSGTVSGAVHTGSGNIYYYGNGEPQRRTVTTGQVIRADLEKIRAVYVAPEGYGRAADVLRANRVLVLWGHANWGKMSTALHLLSELHGDAVCEIDPTVDPANLTSGVCTADQGYVIDSLAPECAGKLSGFLLNQLAGKLRGVDSHLVVTVHDRANISQEAISGYLVSWSTLPDLAQALDRHLVWHLHDGNMLADARGLACKEGVQELLSTHLVPREVDRLAELLVGVARNELGLEDALARFETQASQEVQHWFERHCRLEERTFMVSLAVLNGASYESVVEADGHLLSLVRPPPDSAQPPDGSSVFGARRSQRVREAQAHLGQGQEETEFGPSPVEVVLFDNPSFQPAVLHHVWEEYDGLHRPLISWLERLAHHASFAVRARAAAAIGELSRSSFSYVRKEVLLPWANSPDGQARAAAALALGVPIWDGELAPQVLGLLHHWSTIGNNWRLCWTAAAAYGGLVGLRFPEAALWDLFIIARNDDSRVFGALTRSVATLFRAGRFAPDYYVKVLDALAGWIGNPRAASSSLASSLVFLQLAKHEMTEAPAGGGMWPTLLWLAREDEACRGRVVALWRCALDSKVARSPALEAMRQWVIAVDGDSRLYPTIERILATIGHEGSGREADRLRAYLGRWASSGGAGCRAASDLLSSLGR